MKTDKMKRLLQMSMNFQTKLEDEASVLGFLVHMMKLERLLPPQEDFDHFKANVLRY